MCFLLVRWQEKCNGRREKFQQRWITLNNSWLPLHFTLWNGRGNLRRLSEKLKALLQRCCLKKHPWNGFYVTICKCVCFSLCKGVFQGNLWRHISATSPPGIPQGFDVLFCPGGRTFDHHPQGVGNLIASLDVMLRVTLISRGLINHGGDKLWWIQKKWLRILGGLVENHRPTHCTQALFCIWRPIYIYL